MYVYRWSKSADLLIVIFLAGYVYFFSSFNTPPPPHSTQKSYALSWALFICCKILFWRDKIQSLPWVAMWQSFIRLTLKLSLVLVFYRAFSEALDLACTVWMDVRRSLLGWSDYSLYKLTRDDEIMDTLEFLVFIKELWNKAIKKTAVLTELCCSANQLNPDSHSPVQYLDQKAIQEISNTPDLSPYRCLNAI